MSNLAPPFAESPTLLSRVRLVLCAAALVSAGCYGTAQMEVEQEAAPTRDIPGEEEPTGEVCAMPAAHEVTKLPRRSNDEYRQLASDLVGTELSPTMFVRWTPIAQVYGFDTMTESRIDAQNLTEQMQTTEKLAKMLTSSPAVMSACPAPNDPAPACDLKAAYSPSSDFTPTQGQNCWSYLDGAGGALAYDPANSRYGITAEGLYIWNTGMHPGNTKDAVRRWIAPREGSVTLTGSFSDADPGGGDGVTVAIKKAGANVFSAVIVNGGAPEDFSLELSVKRGDAVDFIVSRFGNTAYDTTGLNASFSYFEAPLSGGWTWDNCAQPVISKLASRAFRRPLRADELADYKILFDNTRTAAATAQVPGTFHEGLRTVLEAVLLSPHVMYKPEFVPGGFDEAEKPYRNASRLSHFFRNSFPDDELWALAQSGALNDSLTVDAQAKRLLEQYPDRFAKSFAGQWLDFRAPITAQDDALTTSMRAEAQATFEEILKSELPPQKLINPGFAIVDQPLATLYGLTYPATGTGPQKIDTTERGGIFAQGYFLTSTAKGSEFKRVIHRGIWTLNRVMCRSLPELDPATLEEIAASFSGIDQSAPLADQMKAHRSRSTRCYSCHSMMDPLGLSLEKYGPDGKWRESYPNGNAVPLNDFKFDETPVRDPKELSAMVEASPAFRTCVAEKLMTYAMNRGVLSAETCVAKDLALPKDGSQPSLKTLTLDAFKTSLRLSEVP